MKFWLIRAGSGGPYWDTWKEKEIITIGWDVGEDIRNLSKEDLKQELRNLDWNFDIGKAAGMLRSVAGVRQNDSKNMREGDKVVVLADADVRSIGIIKYYEYKPAGIPENSGHVYWRHVDYQYNGDPVKITDLPPKFHSGAEASLHLIPTLKRYYTDGKNFNELLEALENTPGTTSG